MHNTILKIKVACERCQKRGTGNISRESLEDGLWTDAVSDRTTAPTKMSTGEKWGVFRAHR